MNINQINSGSVPGDAYFEELLARIRGIRASERLFYLKVLDIYATSIDYDPKAKASQLFFTMVQNKMHYAVHGNTAAEIIVARADASQPNMGLTSWKNAPHGNVSSTDIRTAKNYLSQNELEILNRIVTAYLDFAELQASNKRPMLMSDWSSKLDAFLEELGLGVLTHKGTITREQAEVKAKAEYDKFKKKLSKQNDKV
jgi:hypothetical protein